MKETKLTKLMKKNNLSEDEQIVFERIMKLAKMQYEGSQEDVKNSIKSNIDKVVEHEDKED